MSLPRVNETLNFVMEIPSTGKKVKYRPYLVKEEKVLLQAFESKDTKMCLQAMSDTISACLDPSAEVDVEKLATFDLEYMFTQLRGKSVGEISTILISCKECEKHNEYNIDLDKLKVSVERNKNIIKITDTISVEMRYPTYESFIVDDLENSAKDINSALKILASSVAAILTPSERIDTTGKPKEEIIEFLSSMTASQLKQLTDFLENMPALKHQANFVCDCGAENSLELKGLSDFF